jgi:O-antigen/teichoic acid export membrane protein
MPIFCVGYVFSIFSVLDRTLIIKYLGTQEMGWYTPAIQIGAAFSVLPASINQIIYPKMCTVYGKTGSARTLAKLAFSPVIVLSIALIPVFALSCWLVEPFIIAVLPKYVNGVSAARWMIVSTYFWCLSTSQVVFMTINKLLPYLATIVIAGLANVGTTLWLLRYNWGLSAIGAGRAIGMAGLVISSILVVAYYVFRWRQPERPSVAFN